MAAHQGERGHIVVGERDLYEGLRCAEHGNTQLVRIEPDGLLQARRGSWQAEFLSVALRFHNSARNHQ